MIALVDRCVKHVQDGSASVIQCQGSGAIVSPTFDRDVPHVLQDDTRDAISSSFYLFIHLEPLGLFHAICRAFCSLGSKEGAQKPWAAGPAKRRRGRRPKRRKRRKSRKQGHRVSPKSPRPAMGGLRCQKEARMRHGPQLSNMFHRCPMMSYDWLISRGPGVMMG
jgi:hypothetical protein